MNVPGPLPDARYFSHEAMHTTFSLRLCGVDDADARSLAMECFEQVDLLESSLSRFVEGSEVSRINQLAAGETLHLGEPCHRCLLLALEAYALTGGLFDITLGTRIEHRKSGAAAPEPPLAGKLSIHPDISAITCEEPGRQIDLGGIGKGFALDELRRLLVDRGVEGGLLAAGASSLLAFGPQAWPVDLTGSGAPLRVGLQDQSLSASGTGIQGSHIIHPLGRDAMPADPSRRVWVTAPTAVFAEVWSTALMLIDPGGIPEFLRGNDDVAHVFADRGAGVERIL